MDKTHTSKKKASNTNTPANQSTLPFTATSTMPLNSPPIKPPYGAQDKVATVFQLAFTLPQLAHRPRVLSEGRPEIVQNAFSTLPVVLKFTLVSNVLGCYE